jgi:hypothetical protein
MHVTEDGHFLVVDREQYVARFPATGEDPEQFDDQDIYVSVKGGLTYFATVMTLGAIDRIGVIASACQVIPHPDH